MVFEYWTFGNAGAVLQILNGIAAIMAPTSGIVGAVKVAALLSFLLLVIGQALKNDPGPIMTWLLALTLGWYGLFVPKVTMVVQDTTSRGTAGYAVDNVPLGLAFVASTSSKFSRWMTTSAETVFSLPDSVKFTNAGLMMPQKTLMATSGYTIPNAMLDSDWQSFFHECTYYDLNVYSKRLLSTFTINEDDLRIATDPLTALGKTNKVLFVNIVTGGEGTRTCDEAYDILATATRNLASSSSTKLRYAKMAFPGAADDAERLIRYESALQDANSVLFNSSLNTSQTIINRWMVNLLQMRETRSAVTSGNTGLAMIEFGAIQAQNQRLNAYIQSARAAQDTIPTLRNVMEAVVIGLFPAVFIIMVLAGFNALRLFGEWAMLFLSLQLWGFCYALMNLIMISKSKSNIYAAASSADAVYVSLGNSGAVLEEVAADLAMAGQMAWAIPVICYGIVRGVGSAGMAMAKSMSGPAQSGAERKGAEQGAGNDSMGVAKYGEVSAPGSVSQGTASGTNLYHGGTTGGGGNHAQHTGWRSSSVFSAGSGMVASAALGAAAEKSEQQAKTQAASAEALTQSALAETAGIAQNRTDTQALDAAWAKQGNGSFSQGSEAMKGLTDQIKRATGADQITATNLAMGAGLSTGSLSPVKLSASIGKTYGAQAKMSFEQSQGANDSSTYKAANQFVSTLANSQTARETVTGGTSASKGIEGRMSQAQTLREQSQASLGQAQGLKQQATAALGGNASTNFDVMAANPQLASNISRVANSEDFKRDGEVGNFRGQQERLQAVMSDSGLDAKALASLVQTPQSEGMPATPKAMGDGSATPTSAGMQADHAANAGTVQAQAATAMNGMKAQMPKPNTSAPSTQTLKAEVEAGQQGIQGQVAAGKTKVEGTKAGLSQQATAHLPQVQASSNGMTSLAVPQSQVAAAAKNMGNDAVQTAVGAGPTLGRVAPAAAAAAGASAATAPQALATGAQGYSSVKQATKVDYSGMVRFGD